MVNVFNWENCDIDIITGLTRIDPKDDKIRKKDKRDWKAQYQRRVTAGTANKLKCAKTEK